MGVPHCFLAAKVSFLPQKFLFSLFAWLLLACFLWLTSLLQTPAVPTGSSWGSHLPFWFMLGFDNAESCKDLGKRVSRAQLPSTAAVPSTSRSTSSWEPSCQLTESLAFTEHLGCGRHMDEKAGGDLGLITTLSWVSWFICKLKVFVLEGP